VRTIGLGIKRGKNPRRERQYRQQLRVSYISTTAVVADKWYRNTAKFNTFADKKPGGEQEAQRNII